MPDTEGKYADFAARYPLHADAQVNVLNVRGTDGKIIHPADYYMIPHLVPVCVEVTARL